MKRSQINRYMREAREFMARQKFHLPKWAYWSPEDWANVGHEADEIRDRMLGWDLTDFGSGDFENHGLLLFTLRNGDNEDPDGKAYAEKIMVVREGQITPLHFHWSKMEDIINRGGGNLVVRLYSSDKAEHLSDEPVTVSLDGIRRSVAPGTEIVLEPGDSITLEPYMYHDFWAEPGRGLVLVGEVSKVNDDRTDNRFHEEMGRFPEIEEDEAPLHFLCTEYPPAP